MADNIAITAGAGTSVATEDEGGVHYQKVKLTASGSGTTEDLSKAEDAAHSSGHHGIMALGVRNDSAAALTSADGDYSPVATDDAGRVMVIVNGGVTPGVGASQLGKAEDAAHSSGDAGVFALVVRKDTGASIAGTDGDYTGLQVDANGNLRVALAANTAGSTSDTEDGTIADGQSAVALVVSLPYTFDGDNWLRGGLTPSQTISAASTNSTNVKASAGVVGLVTVSNINAAARYLKLYNKATAPTVGTDTPVQTYLIPASSVQHIPIPEKGIAFSLGIGFGLTTGVAASDTGAVSANEHVVNIGYK